MLGLEDPTKPSKGTCKGKWPLILRPPRMPECQPRFPFPRATHPKPKKFHRHLPRRRWEDQEPRRNQAEDRKLTCTPVVSVKSLRGSEIHIFTKSSQYEPACSLPQDLWKGPHLSLPRRSPQSTKLDSVQLGRLKPYPWHELDTKAQVPAQIPRR